MWRCARSRLSCARREFTAASGLPRLSRERRQVRADITVPAAPSTPDLLDSPVVEADSGGERISLAEIGRIGHFEVGELPNSVQPVLSVPRRYRLLEDLYIFTNGIHGAYVELDADTGFIRLLRDWVVEDCGGVFDPQLEDEQVRGG